MRIRGQSLTVILVPEGGARTFSFRVRAAFLVALGALLLVLLVVSATFVFSYAELFRTSREKERLENRVAQLEAQLGRLNDLEREVLRTEELRGKVLTIFGARGVPVDSTFAMTGATPAAAPPADDASLAQEDFLRTLPRAWPVHGPVTRGFSGVGKDASAFHPGIDIAAATGTPVRAAAAGTVSYAGWDPEYGYLVVLDHGLGLETRYGHNSRLSVKVGDRVERGQTIAGVGSTGRSSAPHLHFEIRRDGFSVDPRQYLD